MFALLKLKQKELTTKHKDNLAPTLQRKRVEKNCTRHVIDVRFSCICPVIDHEFRHNIVKVAVDTRRNSRMDPQTTSTAVAHCVIHSCVCPLIDNEN